MKYDFDTPVDRRGTDCLKWDYLEAFYGREDIEPFWVADMDFKAPPEIIEPLLQRAEHGVFGYTAKPEGFYLSVIDWFRNRYRWQLEKDWIVATPGVVPALSIAIQTLTTPGAGIIIQPPVYFPFRESVEQNGRKLLNNQLTAGENGYLIDFDDLEEKAAGAQMLILCSPHNPVCRVWSEKELSRIGEICKKHDLVLFSDEIHADIVYEPHRHIPSAAVSGELARRTVAAFAPSKTFNLAGLQLSVNVIPDEQLRKEFKDGLSRLHLNMSNIFGIVGTQAAYSRGGEWLDQLIPYLWGNYLATRDYIRLEMPLLSVVEPEGTFLLWIDCRELGLSDRDLSALFVEKAGLALSPGAMFGPGGSGFMRLNIACPRADLMRALTRLKDALSDEGPIPVKSCPKGGPVDG